MGRWTWGLLALIACIVATVAWRYTNKAVSVRTSTVQLGEIEEYVDERGQMRLTHEYDITMPYPGRIEPIAVEIGDPVQPDQIVAQVVDVDLDNEVAEAQAVVDRLQATIAENNDHRVERRTQEQAREFVQSLIHTVAAAAARKTAGVKRLDFATAFLERTRELYQKNAKTLEDVERAEVEHVERQVDTQQDDLVWKSMQSVLSATELLPEVIDEYIAHKSLTQTILEKERSEAEARLRQSVERRLRGTMRSPIAGVVLAKMADDEQFVAAGTELLRIGSPADMEVETEVLSQDATRIQLGDDVLLYGLRDDAQQDLKFQGTVRRVYPQAFTKISSLGVEQQRVKIRVRLTDESLQRMLDAHVGPDYRVRVRIVTRRNSAASIVPRAALFRDAEDQWQVFVIRGGIARRMPVQVGLMNEQQAEITEGLQDTESVVLAPDSQMVDGIRVKETN